jgi:uncharacterized protein (DUF983 family)
MAKRNAWAEAIREQQEPVEAVHIEEYRPGRCRCGEGKFSLSLSEHHIIRSCEACGLKYNVDKGMYI